MLIRFRNFDGEAIYLAREQIAVLWAAGDGACVVQTPSGSSFQFDEPMATVLARLRNAGMTFHEGDPEEAPR